MSTDDWIRPGEQVPPGAEWMVAEVRRASGLPARFWEATQQSTDAAGPGRHDADPGRLTPGGAMKKKKAKKGTRKPVKKGKC